MAKHFGGLVILAGIVLLLFTGCDTEAETDDFAPKDEFEVSVSLGNADAMDRLVSRLSDYLPDFDCWRLSGSSSYGGFKCEEPSSLSGLECHLYLDRRMALCDDEAPLGDFDDIRGTCSVDHGGEQSTFFALSCKGKNTDVLCSIIMAQDASRADVHCWNYE